MELRSPAWVLVRDSKSANASLAAAVRASGAFFFAAAEVNFLKAALPGMYWEAANGSVHWTVLAMRQASFWSILRVSVICWGLEGRDGRASRSSPRVPWRRRMVQRR